MLKPCFSLGSVYYVSENESSDLAYINAAGNAIIKVDNTT